MRQWRRAEQTDLMNAEEMAAKLDPDELEKAVLPILDAETPALIAAAAETIRTGAWGTWGTVRVKVS